MLNGLILIAVFVLTTILIFVTNWLALMSWRCNKNKHWTEQARLAYPVIIAARSNLLILPAIFVLAVTLIWPDSSPLWVFSGVVSMLGAYAGTIPMDRELFPRIPLSALLRATITGILLRFIIYFFFLAAAIFMPDEFNAMSIFIGLAVLLAAFVWSRMSWLWVGKKIGLFESPPERLRNIVASASAKMNVPVNEVLLMRSSTAQAYAFPTSGRLFFSERLMEILSDNEVAAVCAHELAHLTESKKSQYSRYVMWLRFYPWIFFNPLVHNFTFFAFYGLIIVTLMVPRIYSRISLKLESRADEMAKENESDAGIYARALARLYEDNLAPAVSSKKTPTHPHLYDRLLAAGVTPDFPRPAPANAMAWNGHLFATIVGILFAIFAIRASSMFDQLVPH